MQPLPCPTRAEANPSHCVPESHPKLRVYSADRSPRDACHGLITGSFIHPAMAQNLIHISLMVCLREIHAVRKTLLRTTSNPSAAVIAIMDTNGYYQQLPKGRIESFRYISMVDFPHALI